jgi:hypothetical protein
MSPPAIVANDPVLVEAGRNELGDSAIATIREDMSVMSGETLDGRASVVNRIVAVAGTTRRGCNDCQIAMAYQ